MCAFWSPRKPSKNPTWTNEDEKYHQNHVRPTREAQKPYEKTSEEKMARWKPRPSRPGHKVAAARNEAKKQKAPLKGKPQGFFGMMFGAPSKPSRTPSKARGRRSKGESAAAATRRAEKADRDFDNADRFFGGLI